MMTRDEAIKILVDGDVAKWGESEREASEQAHGRRSHGLAVNEVVARRILAGDESKETKALAKFAKSILTAADKAVLRQGG